MPEVFRLASAVCATYLSRFERPSLVHSQRHSAVMMELTFAVPQGDRDGHHHDRTPERWQDFLTASAGGKAPRAPSMVATADTRVQGGEFTIE